MIRYAINPLYRRLECAWFKLCDKLDNKKNYVYRYDVMITAEVLVLPKPPIPKYILYRSICDAGKSSGLNFDNFNNLISKMKFISAQVIQQDSSSILEEAQSRPPPGGRSSRALGEERGERTSALDDLDLIYFIVQNTCLEKEVFDRNCKDELMFKSEEHNKLYKHYLDLAVKLFDREFQNESTMDSIKDRPSEL